MNEFDLDPEEIRRLGHRAADIVADYLEGVEDYAVLPKVQPGELTARLDGPPPEVRDQAEHPRKRTDD